jgi:hypothetical protein
MWQVKSWFRDSISPSSEPTNSWSNLVERNWTILIFLTVFTMDGANLFIFNVRHFWYFFFVINFHRIPKSTFFQIVHFEFFKASLMLFPSFNNIKKKSQKSGIRSRILKYFFFAILNSCSTDVHTQNWISRHKIKI